MCHLLAVALQFATAQDATKHLGVKGLDAAAQNRGVGRHLFHLLAGIAEGFDKRGGAAGAEKLYAVGVELGEELVESVLVEHGYECGLDFFGC